MLAGCNQEKEIRARELWEDCKYTGKHRLPWNSPLFGIAVMMQWGLVVGPAGNPGPEFSALPQTCCSGLNGLGLNNLEQVPDQSQVS